MPSKKNLSVPFTRNSGSPLRRVVGTHSQLDKGRFPPQKVNMGVSYELEANKAMISGECEVGCCFIILITQDLDFSDIRKFQPGTHYGIVVVRLQAVRQ